MEKPIRNQTTEIKYYGPRPIDIGDVFYRIEEGETCNFYSPCKVCNDTRIVTVNGVTFNCPCCCSGSTVFQARKYVVRKYRVYSIEDSVRHDDWKPSSVHTVEFKLYRKIGHGSYISSNHSTCRMSISDLQCLNATFDDIRVHDIGRYFYDDYKLAVSVADKLTEDEHENVREYNVKNGTKYEAIFKTEHDKKST